MSHREFSSVLCVDFDGRDVGSMGGRLPREGVYVCIELGSHSCTAETTQQRKAFILQFKKKKVRQQEI